MPRTARFDSDPRDVGTRLWIARHHAELELDEAAKRLGYSSKHLERLEDGELAPTSTELAAIALLTGCRLAFLKSGEIPVRAAVLAPRCSDRQPES